MNSENLAARMKTNLEKVGGDVTDEKLLKAIAEAIITEIRQNGKVSFHTVGSIIAPPGTAGGPCTGTLDNGQIS